MSYIDKLIEIRHILANRVGVKSKKGKVAVLSQLKAAKFFEVPLRTWEGWEYGKGMSEASLRWMRMQLTKHRIRVDL